MPVRSKPNSADVAQLAGVSRATVSYVLNAREDLSIPHVTRQKVLLAAEKLGYRLNTLAKGLKDGRTPLIGVFSHMHEGSFHSRVLNGIHQACCDRDFNVLTAYIGTDEATSSARFMRLLDYKVSGIIRILGGLSPKDYARLAHVQDHDGVPCLIVDDRSYTKDFDCVVSDDRPGAREAVTHLAAMGHTRIAHLCAGSATSTSRDRHAGYTEGLKDSGLPYCPELVQGNDYIPRAGVEAMEKLLELDKPPTALFAASDILASIAREMARQRGLRVPEDLAIVGYGDTEIAWYSGLSSVAQSPELLGSTAVRRLLTRIEDPSLNRETISLPTHLVARSSSAGGPLSFPSPWPGAVIQG